MGVGRGCGKLTDTTFLCLDQHYANADDDGLESLASSTTASIEDEDSNHHLLTTPNGDVAFLKEKPVRLARELM